MGWTLCGHVMPRDGYGQIVMQCGAELRRMGADVRVLDMRVKGTWGWPGEKRWKVQGDALVACVPEWYEFIAADRLACLTMFESTKFPDERVKTINTRMSDCIVPSRFCAEVFEACGVTVPIHVAPLGIDPRVYQPVDRSGRDGPYTFLWSGTPDLRKGWDLVYRAFYAAFGDSHDARLVMHFRQFPRGVTGTMDRNVRLVEGSISTEDWLALLREADCFVFPSRGEGWGLPPREAAATGLPVIATNWGGLADDIWMWGIPLSVKSTSPAEFGDWEVGEVGEWAEPDMDHLVELMRYCRKERVKFDALGQSAAAWLRTEATWERTARAIQRVMAAC